MLNISEACALYYAAKKYNIKEVLTTARKFMMEKLTISNASEIHETAVLFDDKEAILKCQEMFIPAIYDTTKNPEFFKNMNPLTVDSTKTFFDSSPTQTVSLIGDALKKCIKEIEKERALFNRVNQYLGLIRLLTSKASSIFQLMIPENVAKLNCSLLWVPPVGSFNDLHEKVTANNVSIKCRICKNEPNQIVCCDLNNFYKFEIGGPVLSKYPNSDIGNYAFEDVKKLYQSNIFC